MQSHMTAVADVLFEWSSPWPIDQTAADKLHSYVPAGLPDCEPANVCPQMVMFILSWEGEETKAWQKCVHQAMVASMCWLHSAGATALNTFPRDGPMTFGFREVEQSLCLICKPPAVCRGLLLCVVLCLCSELEVIQIS